MVNGLNLTELACGSEVGRPTNWTIGGSIHSSPVKMSSGQDTEPQIAPDGCASGA